MALGVGVEIGPSAVRAVVLGRTGGSSGRNASTLLAGHAVSCETSNPEALTRALAQLRSVLRIRQPVILGVPTSWAILTTVTPLVVNPRRAMLAVQFELQQQLPFDLLEAAWHAQWLSTEGNGTARAGQSAPRVAVPATISRLSSGSRATGQPGVMVGAMRRAILEERLAACQRAGLLIKAVTSTPVALLNVWHAQHAQPSATAATLLHLIDERTAEWMCWTPTSFHTVPVTSSSPDLLSTDLAASWDALRSQAAEQIRDVTVYGSASAFAPLQQALRASAVAFELCQVQSLVNDAAKVPSAEQSVAAIGLAWQDLGMARVALNLVARVQEEARARTWRRAASLTSGLCALLALACGVSGMREIHQRRSRALESLRSQERLYQTLRPEVRTLLKQQQRRQQQIAQLERVATEGPLVTRLLAEVAGALPDDVWLTKLEWAKTDGVTGVLEGRAKSFQEVTLFFDRLKSLTNMAAVKPMSTNVIADQASGKELIAFAVQIQRASQPSAAGASATSPAVTETKTSGPAQTRSAPGGGTPSQSTKKAAGQRDR